MAQISQLNISFDIMINDDSAIRPLYIQLPQIIGLDMLNALIVTSFKAIDNKLLKKYTKIWKNSAI